MSLTDVLADAKALLFDFDGPLCDVFAGLPAHVVADRLSALIGSRAGVKDPLEVLRLSSRLGLETVKRVEDALIAAEVAAVAKSEATAGGVESVETCLSARLPVGIVSNNSADAVLKFLVQWKLIGKVAPVIGRAYLHPDWMKPNPKPLELAVNELDCAPSEVVFIGDSLTDIQVAATVGLPCVAYANKPGKRVAFSAASAVVDSMWDIDRALRAKLGASGGG